MIIQGKFVFLPSSVEFDGERARIIANERDVKELRENFKDKEGESYEILEEGGEGRKRYSVYVPPRGK